MKIFVDNFSLNQNIIKIYNNKNIKFIFQNLIYIHLKTNLSIKKFKKFNLIFETIILYLKNYNFFLKFLF